MKPIIIPACGLHVLILRRQQAFKLQTNIHVKEYTHFCLHNSYITCQLNALGEHVHILMARVCQLINNKGCVLPSCTLHCNNNQSATSMGMMPPPSALPMLQMVTAASAGSDMVTLDAITLWSQAAPSQLSQSVTVMVSTGSFSVIKLPSVEDGAQDPSKSQ